MKLNADDRIVFSLKPDNTYGLTIHDARVDESATYLARVSSNDKSVFTSAKLTVRQLPIEFSLKFPDSLSVQESTPVKLTCALSRKPPADLMSRLKAFKNDKLIPLSTPDNLTRYEIIEDPENESLISFTIDSAQMSDAGRYSLKLDQSQTSCNLKVIPDDSKAKTPPKLIQDLDTEPSTKPSNEPFSLSIIVQGDDLKAEWYHDDKKIVPTSGQLEAVKLSEPGQWQFKIYFESPSTFDSGKYYCKVSNPFGTVVSGRADIEVKDKKEVPDYEVDESLFQSKPRFVEYFSDVYMEPESEAQFKCKITAKPEPKVVWYCNCRKISANEKFEVLNDGEHYMLVVKGVGPSDEGEYTCKASNCKGEASWSANLYLNEGLSKIKSGKSVAPNFLRKIKDSTVVQGNNAKLDCFVDGDPFPKISWFKNNSPIDFDKNGDKFKLEVDEESGKVCLTIIGKNLS